jgi:hypothetical protein
MPFSRTDVKDSIFIDLFILSAFLVFKWGPEMLQLNIPMMIDDQVGQKVIKLFFFVVDDEAK